MATRSLIFIENPDKSYDYVYCHNCGNYEHNGRILQKYYNSTEKVKELLSFGDMSLLQKNIHPKTETHSFSYPEPDTCIFYKRDRGEDDVYVHHVTEIDYLESFNYIWKDNKWYTYHQNAWVPLSMVLKSTTPTYS